MIAPLMTGRLGTRARRAPRTLLLMTVIVLAACGSDDSVGPGESDPDVAPFVGNWDALEFTVTNLANQEQTLDIVEIGSFSLNVQPSGFYTATLHAEGYPPSVENGQLTVIGSSVRLDPTTGTAVTAAYEFEGESRVILDGPTEFDFNFDQEPETATAHIVLERS